MGGGGVEGSSSSSSSSYRMCARVRVRGTEGPGTKDGVEKSSNLASSRSYFNLGVVIAVIKFARLYVRASKRSSLDDHPLVIPFSFSTFSFSVVGTTGGADDDGDQRHRMIRRYPRRFLSLSLARA
jgi:hypothetical protein